MQANQLTEEEESGSTINVLGQSPQKESLQQYAQQAQQPVSVSGKAPATVGTDQAMPTGPTEPTGSGLFTNIRKFVEANKGAGHQIAGTAKEKVGRRAADVGQAVAKKESELQTNIQQATGQAQTAQTQAQQALKAASTTGQLTPEQIEKFRGVATGTAFQAAPTFDIGQEQKQTEDIARQAELAQTAPGRFGLLREFFGTPEQRYGRGLQRLDVAFLQQDPTARQDIATGLRDISTAAQQEITDAEKLAMAEDTGLIPKYQKQIQGIRTGLETGLEQAQTGVRTGAIERGRAEVEARNQLAAAIRKSLADTGTLQQLSPEQLQALGITAPTGALTSGEVTEPVTAAGLEEAARIASEQALLRGFGDMTPEQLLTGIQEYTPDEAELLQRFATGEEAARARALAQLAGRSPEEAIIQQAGAGLEGLTPGFRDLEQAKADIESKIDQTIKQATGGMSAEDYTELALASGNMAAVPVFNQMWADFHNRGLTLTPEAPSLVLNKIMPEAATPENAEAIALASQLRDNPTRAIPDEWRADWNMEGAVLFGSEATGTKVRPEFVDQANQIMNKYQQGQQLIQELKNRGLTKGVMDIAHLGGRIAQEQDFRRQAIQNLTSNIYRS